MSIVLFQYIQINLTEFFTGQAFSFFGQFMDLKFKFSKLSLPEQGCPCIFKIIPENGKLDR
jgi:hypothetical protein